MFYSPHSIVIHSLPSHVLDSLRHVAQRIQTNDRVLGDFNLNSYTLRWTAKSGHFQQVLQKVSVLDELTHDNIDIDHILVSSLFLYAHSTDALKNMYSDHRAISIRISQKVIAMDS